MYKIRIVNWGIKKLQTNSLCQKMLEKVGTQEPYSGLKEAPNCFRLKLNMQRCEGKSCSGSQCFVNT